MLLFKNRPFALALSLFCAATNVSADRLACAAPATEAEGAICKEPWLPDLALLAVELGDAIGLDIRYSDIDPPNEFFGRLDRLLRTLTVADMEKLVAGRNLWTFDFDVANKILFMRLDGSDLQDMMIVFGPEGNVAYIASEDARDAGRYNYRTVGNVLEVSSHFAPALSIEKFRYQDGCWRLIGEDGQWRDEDPNDSSINYLTGSAFFNYKDGSSITRTFDPFVSCLGEILYPQEITYHGDYD